MSRPIPRATAKRNDLAAKNRETSFKNGGVVLNTARYEEYRRRTGVLAIAKILEARNTVIVKADDATLRKFHLADSNGVPPSLTIATKTNEIRSSITTHGLIAQVALKLLGSIPPAGSLEEGVAQLHTVFDAVHQEARRKALASNPQEPIQVSTALYSSGPPLAPLIGELNSALLRGHYTLVNFMGAIRIMRLPDFQAMKEMIVADRPAQKTILKLQPLALYGAKEMGYEPITIRSIQQLLNHLDALAHGEFKERTNSNGTTDIHTLMGYVCFNHPMHFRAGHLKSVFEKPGRDGKNIWT